MYESGNQQSRLSNISQMTISSKWVQYLFNLSKAVNSWNLKPMKTIRFCHWKMHEKNVSLCRQIECELMIIKSSLYLIHLKIKEKCKRKSIERHEKWEKIKLGLVNHTCTSLNNHTHAWNVCGFRFLLSTSSKFYSIFKALQFNGLC